MSGRTPESSAPPAFASFLSCLSCFSWTVHEKHERHEKKKRPHAKAQRCKEFKIGARPCFLCVFAPLRETSSWWQLLLRRRARQFLSTRRVSNFCGAPNRRKSGPLTLPDGAASFRNGPAEVAKRSLSMPLEGVFLTSAGQISSVRHGRQVSRGCQCEARRPAPIVR